MSLARALLPLALLPLVAASTGCSVFRSLAGENTISLEGAQVRSMSVDLRRAQKTICPRAPVQMAVFAEVLRPGEDAPEKLETWEGGPDANKNDKLDFAEFTFRSPQGSFDQHGWFTPERDLARTLEGELSITTIYQRQPSQFTFTTTYKPDYGCIEGAGDRAAAGQPGGAGAAGEDGSSGATGSSTSPGGAGGTGGSGGPGAPGTAGAPGLRLQLTATMVKTAHYERLVAIVIGGDIDDFLLVPEGQAFTVRAIGGAGGAGGPGGAGGRGGSGGGGNPGGGGGAGGDGGPGGAGGAGGPGGDVELAFDARFPELARQIRIEVDGGPPGAPGSGGDPGSGGNGGSAMSAPGKPAVSGSTGSSGARGPGGATGEPGPAGRVRATPGEVRDRFAAITGVEVL